MLSSATFYKIYLNWLEKSKLPLLYYETKTSVEDFVKKLSFSSLSDTARDFIDKYPEVYNKQYDIYYSSLYIGLIKLGYKTMYSEKILNNIDSSIVDCHNAGAIRSWSLDQKCPSIEDPCLHFENTPLIWNQFPYSDIVFWKKKLPEEIFNSLVDVFLKAEKVLVGFPLACKLLSEILLSKSLTVQKLEYTKEKLFTYLC